MLLLVLQWSARQRRLPSLSYAPIVPPA
jgi:hypothetical protein